VQPPPNTTYNHTVCGAEFVSAWKHIHDDLASSYANLKFVWTVEAIDFKSTYNGKAINDWYYPGDTETDYIGFDQYNFGCTSELGTYFSFADMIRNSVTWNLTPPSTSSHVTAKPMVLAEWGAIEGSSPNDRPAFISGVPDALRQSDNTIIKLVSYWNGVNTQADGFVCNFNFNSTPDSQVAFAQAGLDPWVKAPG
jgi:hypothetical protein